MVVAEGRAHTAALHRYTSALCWRFVTLPLLVCALLLPGWPSASAASATLASSCIGNRTKVTDANGHSQSFGYDAANRLTSAADALNNTTSYAYDGVGNLVQTTLPTGVVNRQSYDSRNRLVGIDPGNTGTPSISYAYDTASRRTSMTDPTGSTTYAYDTANRLTGVTAPATPPLTTTVSMAYDAAGERTSLTYPSGHQLSYAYTARGQLQSVTDWLSNQTSYSYDNAGRLTAINSPNGVAGSLSYDSADRLTSISYQQGTTSLERIGYTRDAVGNPTQMTDSTGSTSYGYDALDRLTSATYPNADAVSYAYDAVGNRTGLTVNGSTTTSTFDAADRLTQAGSTTYTYDQSGNELTKTAGGVTTTYSYDLLNRLTGISGPTTASYAYNGDGLRVSKTVQGTPTSYTWDPTGLGHVVADGSGDEFLWGQGLIGQVTGAVASYAHSDGLGSIRLVTGAAGAVLGRQSYDAYGSSRSQSGTPLPFGYAGEQTDAESGLVYLRSRYYDSTSGRFLTRDTFPGTPSDPQSLNRYGYAESNPAVNTDPSGRCIGPAVLVCLAVLEAAPEIAALGVALVSSPILVTLISSSFEGAQANVDTLLCPNASTADKAGAAVSLGLAALAVLPGGEEIRPVADSYEQARNAALEAIGEIDPATRRSVIGNLGVGEGKIVGFFTRVDGVFKRLRLDYDPVKGPHINVDIGKGNGRQKIAFPWQGIEDDVARQLDRFQR